MQTQERIKRPMGLISFIQFGTLTRDEFKRYGVEITKSNIHDGPTHGTPYDERLGALDNGKVCMHEGCGLLNLDCPGHFGVIDLEEPVYNPEFVSVVAKIFRCICVVCSKPKIKDLDETVQSRRMERLKRFEKRAECVSECPFCQSRIPSVEEKNGVIRLIYSKEDGLSEIVTARKALKILKTISNETMTMLGFNDGLCPIRDNVQLSAYLDPEKDHPHQIRPESFIVTVLPVLPTACRPWVERDVEQKDDDLTGKYNIILKLNEKLRRDREFGLKSASDGGKGSKGAKRKLTLEERAKVVEDLSMHVSTLIDNRKGKSVVSNGRVHKGIRDRLGKKEGQIQTNVAGKRVDFSSRTVITAGGPMLEADEIGIPKKIAEKLTNPLVVTEFNMEYCYELLAQHRVNFICKSNGATYQAKIVSNNPNFRLQPRDTLDVQLHDGDIYIQANRQPTLRLESMQGARVKIIDGYAIRLPLCVTCPYNADFDGDEMNCHAPQSIYANAECSTIMSVKECMVSVQNNAAVMGLVQNGLVGCYLATNPWQTSNHLDFEHDENEAFELDGNVWYETMISKDFLMDCLVNTVRVDAPDLFDRVDDLKIRAQRYYPKYIVRKAQVLSFAERIPAKILFSFLLPRELVYEKSTETNPLFPTVKIKHGIILPDSAPLCKRTVGPGKNTIPQMLWHIYSPDRGIQFLTEAQRMTDYFCPFHGLSMGVSDCIPINKILVAEKLTEMDAKCHLISDSYKAKGLIRGEDRPEWETPGGLDRAERGNREERGDRAEQERAERERENEIINEANLFMSFAPNIVKTSMNKGERNSLRIMKLSGAKGNDVNNAQISYVVGAQVVDGKRVAKQLNQGERTLPHFLPHDDSLEARGFCFGNFLNGLKPTENYFHAISGRKGVVDTAVKTSESGYIQKQIGKKLEDFHTDSDFTVRNATGGILEFFYGDDGMSPKRLLYTKGLNFPFFCDTDTLAKLKNAERELEADFDESESPVKIDPEIVSVLCTHLKFRISRDDSDNEVLKRININLEACCKKVLSNVSVYPKKIAEFCKEVKIAFEKAKIQPKSMVGHHATLSIGEPTTQCTLNTFHFCGLSAKDVTLGVPRLKEILHVTKKPSKPTSNVVFLPEVMTKAPIEYEEALEFYSNLGSLFEFKTIKEFIKTVEMRFVPSEEIRDPLGFITFCKHHPDWWENMAKVFRKVPQNSLSSPWILRLIFDVEKLYQYRYTLEQVADAIEDDGKGYLVCLTSPQMLGIIDVYTDFGGVKKYITLKNSKCKTDLVRPFRTLRKNLPFYLLKKVVLRYIQSAKLGGVNHITRSYPKRELSLNKEYVWSVDLQGSNYMKILAIPGVDTFKTSCDAFWEIQECFGIEAARAKLIKELEHTISFDGTYVNRRHFSLLASAMTYRGTMTSVSRNGLGEEAGVVSGGMFEKSVDTFSKATVETNRDLMKGVASSVMFGALASVGTGPVEIYDLDRMPVAPLGR